MNTNKTFIFKYYIFDETLKTLELRYGYPDGQEFSENYYFDFTFADYDNEQLNRAFENLLILAGVSYFKAYAPKNIELSHWAI